MTIPSAPAHFISARRSYYGREKLLSFMLAVLEGALTPLGQKRESPKIGRGSQRRTDGKYVPP